MRRAAESARRPWRSAPSPELSYPCPTVTGMAQTQCTAGPEGPASSGEPGDVPRRPALSPSRANDFKQCPLLYRFRAIDRLPEVPTAAQVRGTLVHAVLEGLFLLPAEERTPEAARALLGPTWAAVVRRRPRAPRPRCSAASSGPDRSGPDDCRARAAPNAGRPRASRPGWRAPGGCSTPTSPSRTRACSNRRPGSCSSRSSWSRGCCCAGTSIGSTARARTVPRSGWSTTRPAARPGRSPRRGRCSR